MLRIFPKLAQRKGYNPELDKNAFNFLSARIPMPVLMPEPKGTLLGQSTVYGDSYDPTLIQPIPRSLGRDAIGDHHFRGTDIWRLYELSWLAPNGLPQTAVGEIFVPASTHSIVESKSLKLYAGSFAMTTVASLEEVEKRMEEDLGARIGEGVRVKLSPAEKWAGNVTPLLGTCLETLPEAASHEFRAAEADALVLRLGADPAETGEKIWSTRIFRSLCPVTGQPDYAAVVVRIRGRGPAPMALLDYLVSYRRHRGFHEQCVEQIFHDLRAAFSPEMLEVYAAFTRRGGIDINPFRSTERDLPASILREIRQ